MKTITIILFNFLFLIFSCKDKPETKTYSIKVVNNASLAINCSYQNIYPDTSLPVNKPSMTIVGGNNASNITSQLNWEQVFSEAPKDTISFFVFSPDTLNFYPWYYVRDGYIILKRYDLGIQDMQNSNFTITYP